MKTYTCLVIIFTYFPFADFTTWPSSPGCNEEQDIKECVLRFYCFDIVRWPYSLQSFDYLRNYEHYNDFISNCYEYHRTYDGRNNLKIALAFKIYSYSETNNQIPSFENTYGSIPWIYSLDISYNNLNDFPNLRSLEKLEYLNVSHNNITVAKLYSTVNFPSLIEIDYSYNNINNFDVSGEGKFDITSLILAHNNLVSLPNNLLEKYSKLNNLDLSNNHIKIVQMQTFEGLNNLIFLNLSHNNLKDINSAFFRFNKLKILNLSHNKIEVMNTQDFIHLQNLEILDISVNCLIRIEKTIFSGMALLKQLNMTHNVLELIDKDIFLNNSHLASVDISNNNFHSLPKDLFKDKYIFSFSVEGNKLEGSLVKGIFDGLTMVSHLDLSYQLLSSIEDYAFFGLGQLERLVLRNNNLNLLTKKSFRSLLALNYLDLANNKITNLDFEKDDLVSLRFLSLEHNFLKQIGHDDYVHLNALNFLNLAHNNISKLEPKTFKSLKDLIYFEISNNPLSGKVEEGTFDGFSSLPKLDISGTELTTISNNSFIGMLQLKDFNVSHSFISILEYNAFMNTSHIQSIDLSYNRLSVFFTNPIFLFNLITLNLNNNMLSVISESTFKGIYQLKIIDLAYNDIKNISDEAFKDQTDLQHLALSHNKNMYFNVSIVKNNRKLDALLLSGLHNQIIFSDDTPIPVKSLQLSEDRIKNINKLNLRTLLQLENIVLKQNYISIINVGDICDVKYLKTLDLSHNKITSIQPGAFTSNTFLSFLNISHNMLSELNYGIFDGLISLRILDVSFNALKDLKSERFYHLQNLDELVVDHNNIDSFEAQEFNALRILSIGENPLPCDVLINFNKFGTPFKLTAINIVKQNQSNVNGITCNKKKKSSSINNTENTKLSEYNQVLFEIRDELVRIANENKFQINSSPTNYDDSKSNASELLDKVLKQNDQQLSHLTNYSAVLVKEASDSNTLLQKIVKLLTVNRKTTTVIPFTMNNATLDNILPYINKIKQDLEDLITSEKENIMDDINSKLSSINARLDSTKSSTIAYIPANQDLLQKTNNKEQSKSVFTEVCVGMILFILVGYILYTFYKSRLFIRPRRTSSTRELESPNL